MLAAAYVCFGYENFTLSQFSFLEPVVNRNMDFMLDLLMGPLVASFLLGFTTILLLIWYSMKKHTYWKDRNVPFVKPIPILGSVMETFTLPLHDVELNRYKKYGRIYGHYEGNRPLLSVADPDILRNVLVKDFAVFTGRRRFDTDEYISSKILTILNGEDWKRVRTIVTPTFTTGKIKKMLSIFMDCSKTLVSNFVNYAKKDEVVDAKRVYGAFSMDIIASSAFSTKIDSHNDPNNEFVSVARRGFSRNVNWRFVMYILCPGFMKFFKIKLIVPEILTFFKDITLQIIEERKRTGQTRNDFLQLLLDTSKEVEDNTKGEEKETEDIISNYGENESQEIFKNASFKKTLSHEELIAQCVIFFLAGYDTTASTLSFASYLLALYPDVQNKLIKEIDNVVEENNGKLTYEAIQSMKYLDNVISETLRLYPPAVRIERLAEEDYKLGDTGITIPKGSILTIPVYAMHRDSEFFPNPERFDPDRFNAEERAKRSQYSYMPFGAGPRNCVGMRFALMEIKVCLALVLNNFKIKKCSETKVPLEFYAGQPLLQPKGINIKFEIREDNTKIL